MFPDLPECTQTCDPDTGLRCTVCGTDGAKYHLREDGKNENRETEEATVGGFTAAVTPANLWGGIGSKGLLSSALIEAI